MKPNKTYEVHLAEGTEYNDQGVIVQSGAVENVSHNIDGEIQMDLPTSNNQNWFTTKNIIEAILILILIYLFTSKKS